MVTVEYRHQFSYRCLEEENCPALQLRVSRQNSSESVLDVDAHLDSGASSSLFDGFVIASLGIALINDKLKYYNSTSGNSIEAYVHPVRLTVPNVGDFDLEIGFSNGRIRRNLLGRDFFNLAQIGFRERQLEYYLTPTP